MRERDYFFTRYIDANIVVVLIVIELHDYNHIYLMRMRENQLNMNYLIFNINF
jgi:hypothetical protein